MNDTRFRCGQVAADVGLVVLAGVFLIAGLIAFEGPQTQRYPPPPASDWIQAVLIGGPLVLVGLAVLAYVVLRDGRGWRRLRRLAGVLAVGALFPALIGAGNAAYFGANAIALWTLGGGVAFAAAGAVLLRRT